MLPGMNLSEALRALDGPTSVIVSDDGSRLVTFRHGDAWRVGFRLTRAGDKPGPWEMAEFATVYTGSESATAEMLRRLPLGELLRQARSLVTRSQGGEPALRSGRVRLVDLGEAHLASFLADGRGRSRRTDEDYAWLAWEYLLLVWDGDRSPAKTLSERHGHGSAAVWSNRISEARRRGLLRSAQTKESGAHLTEKGERLLFPNGLHDDAGAHEPPLV
jgi:hypothetical protein